MKKKFISSILVSIAIMLFAGIALTESQDYRHKKLLPEKFPVYVYDSGVVNTPYPGTTRKL